jgi:hypothetical protein
MLVATDAASIIAAGRPSIDTRCTALNCAIQQRCTVSYQLPLKTILTRIDFERATFAQNRGDQNQAFRMRIRKRLEENGARQLLHLEWIVTP